MCGHHIFILPQQLTLLNWGLMEREIKNTYQIRGQVFYKDLKAVFTQFLKHSLVRIAQQIDTVIFI